MTTIADSMEYIKSDLERGRSFVGLNFFKQRPTNIKQREDMYIN
jgi:hypothetical protein